ncbi:MAG: hypothetical protein CL836_08780 [Crocinitomicaceae bacterium]|nr:hypothetical protein [Crocinitomicaceae bacterium]
MNEDIQLKIISLIDDGATIENSPKLKMLIEVSEDARKFYESLLLSESMLKRFIGGDKAEQQDKKIDAFIQKQLEEPKNSQRFNFKPIAGFAVAASLAIVALTFVDIPLNISSEEISISEDSLYPDELIIVEQSKPLIISGAEMKTLWSTATEIAVELGVDRYEIMYVVYEGNKDSFVDNNIHKPRQDEDYYVDLSLIENLDKSFIVNEVKRHMLCYC